MDNDAIYVLLKRLSRPDGSGGAVMERAAIMAEGARVGGNPGVDSGL